MVIDAVADDLVLLDVLDWVPVYTEWADSIEEFLKDPERIPKGSSKDRIVEWLGSTWRLGQ